MKIDLSDYKLAYFQGDSFSKDDMTQDQVMVLKEAGKLDDSCLDLDLVIGLIPKEAKLTDCDGDDWDDRPASSNASGFYKYPKGTIILKGRLGKELKI